MDSCPRTHEEVIAHYKKEKEKQFGLHSETKVDGWKVATRRIESVVAVPNMMSEQRDNASATPALDAGVITLPIVVAMNKAMTTSNR